MDDFKEFQGKTLDEAMQDACSYFNANREKLEIEIVQDAKSGIFGIVGARKAIIHARRVRLRDAVDSVLTAAREEGAAANTQETSVPGEKDSQQTRPEAAAQYQAELETSVKSAGAYAFMQERVAPAKKNPRGRSVRAAEALADVKKQTQPDEEPGLDGGICDDTDETSQYRPFSEVDAEEACSSTVEVISRLIRFVTGENADLSAELCDSRVQVTISGVQDCGLLIGREGITLAAVQYVASRIVSKKLQASVRVQLDVGDYRQKQDEKIREMAVALAEKVKQTGRSYSTRPLSSYHRRVVHMCLRDLPGIQTRSTGDGAMKRVVIMRRRGKVASEKAHEE